MMNVLTQNEAMNQTDNDAFVVPLQEEVIQPSENPIQAQEPVKEKPVQDSVQASEELAGKESVDLVDIESTEVLVSPVMTPTTDMLPTSLPVFDDISPVQTAAPEVVASQEVQIPVIDVDLDQPLPQYTPMPKVETPVQIDVPFIEDVPEVIMEFLPKAVVSPQREQVQEQNPIHIPVEAAEVLPALPNIMTAQKEVKRDLSLHDSSKEPEKLTVAPKQLDAYTAPSSSTTEMEIEEDPKVRFIRYVEKEVVTPKFAKGQDESLHVPEEMQVSKESNSPNTAPSNGVLGAEKTTRSVSAVTRSEGTQASSLLEKGSAKEELKMPKRKLEQSFAKLLKEAKDLAEDFEPEFHTKILKKLEIQVKDPAGIIQLEIAQKEATVHVRAVVPSEAMSDLHYLGQDVQESLQDLGLQLGSYELRSQDEEEEQSGFGGIDEVGFDDIETEDVEVTNSDYIVDKRV